MSAKINSSVYMDENLARRLQVLGLKKYLDRSVNYLCVLAIEEFADKYEKKLGVKK